MRRTVGASVALVIDSPASSYSLSEGIKTSVN